MGTFLTETLGVAVIDSLANFNGISKFTIEIINPSQSFQCLYEEKVIFAIKPSIKFQRLEVALLGFLIHAIFAIRFRQRLQHSPVLCALDSPNLSIKLALSGIQWQRFFNITYLVF